MGRIFGILAILIAVGLGASWYVHRARIRALNSGDVFVREQSSDTVKPAAPSGAPANQPAPPPEIATTNGAPAPAAQPQTQASLTVPASDTIPRNPPNGAVFAGAGKYQLYRQGDITWRVDTETGAACILFATDAQWSRVRVYQHGCGSNAEISSARGN
jgi:hypothetical protein